MQPKIILCVDDEKVVLDSLQRELNALIPEGYRVELAESAQEALELLEELSARGFDIPLVISDHIMPGILGDELLIRLHQWRPSTRKIMLTGQADSSAVGRVVNQDALYRFIGKPWNATDLALTVLQALRSYEMDLTLAQQNDQLRRLNHELEALVAERTHELRHQAQLLEQKNRDILDSIQHAKRIQDALLPKATDLKKIVSESFVYYQPRDIVSGDLFFLHSRRKQLYLAVIDCTGHGVPGAFMTFLAHNQLSQIFREHGQLPVHQVLDELNLRILTNLKQAFATQQVGKVPPMDGMDIALIQLDIATGEVEFAGANLPLYLVQEGSLERIRGTVRPIGGTGLMERIIDFHARSLQLRPGDTLYLSSDGISDQFGRAEGSNGSHKFTSRRFREMLAAISVLPIAHQCDAVRETLKAWQGDEPQTDDQLLIGIQWAGN